MTHEKQLLSLHIPGSSQLPLFETVIVIFKRQESAFIKHSFVYVFPSEPQTGLKSFVHINSHFASTINECNNMRKFAGAESINKMIRARATGGPGGHGHPTFLLNKENNFLAEKDSLLLKECYKLLRSIYEDSPPASTSFLREILNIAQYWSLIFEIDVDMILCMCI